MRAIRPWNRLYPESSQPDESDKAGWMAGARGRLRFFTELQVLYHCFWSGWAALNPDSEKPIEVQPTNRAQSQKPTRFRERLRGEPRMPAEAFLTRNPWKIGPMSTL